MIRTQHRSLMPFKTQCFTRTERSIPCLTKAGDSCFMWTVGFEPTTLLYDHAPSGVRALDPRIKRETKFSPKKISGNPCWLPEISFSRYAFLFHCPRDGSSSIFPTRFHYSSFQICLPHFGQQYSTRSLYTVRNKNVFISLFLLPVGTFPEWLHPLSCPITSNPPTTSAISFIYIISVFILLHLFFFYISFCFFFLALIRRFIHP